MNGWLSACIAFVASVVFVFISLIRFANFISFCLNTNVSSIVRVSTKKVFYRYGRLLVRFPGR